MKELTVRADAPLTEAFARLRGAKHRLLAVVDGDGRVCGTVSDGDIRRAAIGDPRLEEPVVRAMPRSAATVAPGASDDEVLQVLCSRRARSVAVVEHGRLVGLRSIDEFPEAAPPDPVAVVMVGGRGERLRPLTDKVPKPLLKVGGHSIVERIIMSLAGAGVRHVYLAVNYLSDMFEERLGDGSRLGVGIEYVREDEPMGTAGALGLLPEVPDVPLIVTNGDLVTTIDWAALVDFHRHHGSAITVAGVEHRTHIPYGVLRTAEHHLLGVDEKPERVDFVNAGMYVLEPSAMRYIPSAPMLMTDLLADLVADGLPVHVFPVLEQWFDIGSPDDFERVLMAFATGEEE